jgi:hypothetical protein
MTTSVHYCLDCGLLVLLSWAHVDTVVAWRTVRHGLFVGREATES